MNILLTLAYNGRAYHGWQVQSNALAVCTVVQNAMERVLGARPDVKGCSRTDAGVHARAFCLSFKHETAIPSAKLPLALNSHLPPDVRVLHARRVPEGFHARYSAVGKQYRYEILNAAIDDPFRPGLYHRVTGPLDAEKMAEAARHFVGKQDFASFQSVGSSITDTVRTVTHADVRREGDWVYFTVEADGFLYNMVRIMAGTLVRAGRGTLQPEAVPGILAAHSRAEAGETLPAGGLFLQRVIYPPEAFL